MSIIKVRHQPPDPMVNAAFSKGRVQRLTQLFQRGIRRVEPRKSDLLQRGRKGGKPVLADQLLNDFKLLMASVHLLLKIRAVTIHCAINRFQHLPPYAQVLDMHYAGMRAPGL